MFLFSRFILSDSVNMILSIPQFEIVRYAQLVTRQECRDLLPGDAGVYAWFRDLTLCTVGNAARVSRSSSG